MDLMLLFLLRIHLRLCHLVRSLQQSGRCCRGLLVNRNVLNFFVVCRSEAVRWVGVSGNIVPISNWDRSSDLRYAVGDEGFPTKLE